MKLPITIAVFQCLLLLLGRQAAGASLEDGGATLSLAVEGKEIQARLSSPAMKDFAVGPYIWQATVDNTELNGLKRPQIKTTDKQTLVVTGKLGPLDVEQRFTLLENAGGFDEVIRLHNPTGKDVVMDDIRTGFSRQLTPAADPYRLVAVPYRRQANGSLHDYSMTDVAAVVRGTGKINPTCQPAWAPRAPLVDEIHRRMRSESWILTDGQNGLLVLKYNNNAIEHSAVNWIAEQNRLIFGGCAFVLHKEPAQANRIKPGETFRFGQTRYEFYRGGWPEGYAIYKSFVNSRGHGLTKDYQPQVQWEILFDVGDQRWSRESVLQQAALAREVGCTRIYFDPGWQVPSGNPQSGPLWGSARWDETRLGPVDQMIKLLRDSYGLELGLWTAARVVCDWQWPREYYRQIPLVAMKVPMALQGRRNLSLLPSAKSAASSVFLNGSIPGHQTRHLNDGFYGNARSWIAGAMPAWVEIDLGREYAISQVCVSNDNTQQYTDRAAGSFRILTATRYNADTKADTWRAVAEYKQYGAALKKRMCFSFEPATARWVRVELLEPAAELARIDELEIYEAAAGKPTADEDANPPKVDTIQTTNELCMSHEKWLDERFRRLSKLTKAGVSFLMFDFHGWIGPCYAADHGHAVPATTIDHVHSIYGVARKLRQQHPNLRIEMHDAIWPWGCRYLPSYFRQGLADGDYDENWAYEFMWNTIEDIRSKRAMCLYYYNLAYDIPMYLHFNMHADNDRSLAFWWLASTVRHIGFGGRTNATRMEPHGPLKKLSLEQQQRRFDNYKNAMTTYNRLKRYFTHGRFIGIGGDETLHLHALPDQPGGVLMVFNLSDKPVRRTVRVPLRTLNLGADDQPPVVGATGRVAGGDLLLELDLAPESPAVVEIGAAAAPAEKPTPSHQ